MSGTYGMYGKINYAAVDNMARQQAPNHPAILAAGRFWAESLGLDGEQGVHFAELFAFYFVQSTLLVGGSVDGFYRKDICGAPLTGQILSSTCADCQIDLSRLPQYTSISVTPFEVTVYRGSSCQSFWSAEPEASVFDGHPIC